MTVFTIIKPSGRRGDGYTEAEIEAGREFLRLLPLYWILGRIVTPDFTEKQSDGSVTIDGLEALQQYRERFGFLNQQFVVVILLPRHLAPEIPGSGGRRYRFGMIFDEVFYIPVEGDSKLPPGAPRFAPGTPPALACVRFEMWLDFREVDGKLMVCGRCHNPLGQNGAIEVDGQHAWVTEQIQYYSDHPGQSMIEDGTGDHKVRPIEEIAAELHPGLF